MTKKIFRSIALATVLVLVASVVLIMGVLYTHFLNVQFDQMKAQAVLATQGIDKNGEAYTEGLKPEGYRLTLIDPQGKVLYDSKAEPGNMENHLQREEVQMALEEGEGQSSRYSTTLLERQLYVARVADDGSIVRISDSQHSMLGLLVGMLQQIIIVASIGLLLSLILAYRLSRRIIDPLNDIDLDKPNKEEVYEELHPLLDRILLQKEQIRIQTDELMQKRREFEALTANMEEGLLILDEDGRIVSINRAASQTLGFTRNCLGMQIAEAVSSKEFTDVFSEAIAGEKAERGLEISGRQYELHASPVITQGRPTAAVIFILDVSQRLRAEQMRREFTANVSHELKTPLQTISGSAELIAGGIVKPEDIPEFGMRIYKEAGRLMNLIDDIIDLSKLDEGADDTKREETDLLAVAEYAVAGLTQTAAASDVKLTLSGESAMVIGDITLLRSIAHNLCENAIKYSSPGGSVDVKVGIDKDKAVLIVKDDGIGIPEGEQERIFERFYRVDKGRSKEVGGTGLGLSIVKHAVLIHHGNIEVDSRPGEGTKITVTLPAAEA